MRQSALIFMGLWVASNAFAQGQPSDMAVPDSVWEINSRELPSTGVPSPMQGMVFRRVQGTQWLDADSQDFIRECQQDQHRQIAGQPRTVFYVHGNWTSADDVRKRGWLVYERLAYRSRTPIRFIMYSWAADRHGGFARDLMSKRERLSVESRYLADVLQQIDRDAPLGMLGFSFGAAVISGALHLDAADDLSQMPAENLRDKDMQTRNVRVSFTAPAFDQHALTPEGQYHLALTNIEKLLNLYNSDDPVLKRFRFFDRRSAPVAAGFEGLVSFQQPPSRKTEPLAAHPKILQLDCNRQVGRTHAEMAYIQECAYFEKALDNLIGL